MEQEEVIGLVKQHGEIMVENSRWGGTNYTGTKIIPSGNQVFQKR